MWWPLEMWTPGGSNWTRPTHLGNVTRSSHIPPQSSKKKRKARTCLHHPLGWYQGSTLTNLKISQQQSNTRAAFTNCLQSVVNYGVSKCKIVNKTTTPMSNNKAMEQMGQALWRLVATIGNTNHLNGPIMFAKWDIKDGFWRLVVLVDNAWHFVYVLPWLKETDPIKIVVPTCLQMGWYELLPLFCTASETAAM